MKRSAFLQAAAGAAAATVAPAVAADLSPLRVSFEPVNTLTPFYAAQEQGFFRRNGLQVEPQSLNGGAAALSALTGGSLDVVSVNVVSMAQARQRGLPIIYIALGSLYAASSPADALLVPKDSPLRTAREFSGKTVATSNLKGLGYIGTRAWLDANGGDSSSVRFIEMSFDLMPTALESHQVDAAMIAEPAMQRAWAQSRLIAYAYDAIAPTVLISGWASTPAWLERHRDVAKRFNDALVAAEQWCDANFASATAIAARYLKMDPAAIRAMSHAPYPEKKNAIPLAQPLLDASLRYGVITSSVPARELFADYLR